MPVEPDPTPAPQRRGRAQRARHPVKAGHPRARQLHQDLVIAVLVGAEVALPDLACDKKTRRRLRLAIYLTGPLLFPGAPAGTRASKPAPGRATPAVKAPPTPADVRNAVAIGLVGLVAGRAALHAVTTGLARAGVKKPHLALGAAVTGTHLLSAVLRPRARTPGATRQGERMT